MEKTRGIKTNCGEQLARPYVNNQTLTKMYNYNAYLYKSPKNRLGGRR